jgi:hypothetical protein
VPSPSSFSVADSLTRTSLLQLRQQHGGGGGGGGSSDVQHATAAADSQKSPFFKFL